MDQTTVYMKGVADIDKATKNYCPNLQFLSAPQSVSAS